MRNEKTPFTRATIAALAMLTTAAAVGQTDGEVDVALSEGVSAEQGPPEGKPEIVVLQPEDRRLSELIGAPVFDVEGTEIGEIDDFILADDGTLKAVLAIGGIVGLGEKLVLVGWERLETSSGAETGAAARGVHLPEVTGAELADTEPRFRYEPK